MTSQLAAPSAADRQRLTELARTSHTLIRRHQDASGAYPASPTFSAYRGYAWLRDGAFIAEGMSRWGDVASVDAFHDWTAGTLAARADQVAELVARAPEAPEQAQGLLLPTRFRFDGSDGDDDWWDFQTDGYGTWLWQLVTHTERHGGELARWAAGIEVAVDFLGVTASWPCYDWWEEHAEHRHTSSLAAVVAGLRAVLRTGVLDGDRAARAAAVARDCADLIATRGTADGRLTKWLGSDAVDGSLPACVVPFGVVEVGSPVASATLAAVAEELLVDGGVHRFRADTYFGGGQWLLLSCLLGWNLAVAGEHDRAGALLRWVADQADESGSLPEQVPDHLLHPERRQEWVDRWGPVADPLLWSHAMYLILADELGLLPEDRRA
ncbi:glycoside hydrolase family 15 protein [Pseudactinotalea suaedae]|uniref:glycoside hydrolase family 15 protein n=1 Tax=Pseudactinotalea suaedae TaxID=1524924 RepID=UPI0012E17E0B|nr:glycoside hydrolase family 15 protein [Pseudactinotalea suaedae]